MTADARAHLDVAMPDARTSSESRSRFHSAILTV